MTSSDRRLVAVMTSDEVHTLRSVRDFKLTKRGRNRYVATAACGIETTGPLQSTNPDGITCPACRERLPR